jgi:hypothetical protein
MAWEQRVVCACHIYKAPCQEADQLRWSIVWSRCTSYSAIGDSVGFRVDHRAGVIYVRCQYQQLSIQP